MKKILTMIAAAGIALSASAGVVAFTDSIEGGRLNLHDDACEMFTGADGKAVFVVSGGGEALEGCWKYSKESNEVLLIINGIALELPAILFTSP
jgi:hypothetical protein